MLKSPLFWKITTLIGCIVLLSLPLMIVRELINERADYRSEVVDAIEQSTSGPQKLAGPLIAIPVTETLTRRENQKEVEYQRSWEYYWLPESLAVSGKQTVESRRVGIYSGQVWHNALQIKASFDPLRLAALKKTNIVLGQPRLVVSVGDARGIGAIHAPEVNGSVLSVEPGLGISGDGAGIHMPMPALAEDNKPLEIAFSLDLNGTGAFSLVPLGRNSELQLTSNWLHPGFLGSFLPTKREVNAAGYRAHWQSSWFANDMGSYFKDDMEIPWSRLPAFSADVMSLADQYQLTDRATKYAILLIGLTFMAFFAFESLTHRPLHPMQYLLVGLSLVLFYLVLLALSEHIGFTAAWLAASLSGAVMNGIYLQAVLRGWRNSLLFVAALLLLDGVMWFLLHSEDSALLLGTGVLVLALSSLMFLTRRVDWYALSLPKGSVPPPPSADDDKLRLWKE
ncbi:cell envelope integrity protein CreD [Klebsiella quasipneumoniae]|uniref:cell envelope integrity protein CreD n=1 Tax=Klebsiella quasipneumoniae TaxID=1463165 RepID=UPI0010D96B3A|nr:cell envelope integrity protein CreD [Klebsiella quasipneumoniae]HBR1694544.1 cell envelope integrity protein CreD [Klebsiella quasipneumoniae subsp. quasipneumoniae]MBC9921808.1 cell envelope integrity protein CreD [Klebsiella quasipneumoniae]MBC9938504.1 cell envelope integrity protein CreD [Klebsiella quasipneumoniae]MBC9948472.1 cell envelope integrity protein CreD [Klebsiella quasipneumoniae]QQX95609.1 cell envelope integrity protein CreD [Klebsiella quasipneumoniae]